MIAEQVQLKVCEGCGGLWVKPAALGGVYCDRCYGRLKAFPKVSELARGKTGLRKTMLSISPSQGGGTKKRRGLTLCRLHAVAVAGGAR